MIRAGFAWLLVLPLVVALARHVQLVMAPPAGLLEAIANVMTTKRRSYTEAAFRGPIVDRRGRPLAISSPGIQLFVDLVARREKHEYEMGTPAGRARFPEGVTPATEWDLQLMDFALEVAHLFPELAMSPAEIEATIHEAELKIEPEEETPDTANWATCCSRPLPGRSAEGRQGQSREPNPSCRIALG